MTESAVEAAAREMYETQESFEPGTSASEMGGGTPRSQTPPESLVLAMRLAEEMQAALRTENIRHHEIHELMQALQHEERESTVSSSGSGARRPGNLTPSHHLEDCQSDTSSVVLASSPGPGLTPRRSIASMRLSTASGASTSSQWTTSFMGHMNRASMGISLGGFAGAPSDQDPSQYVARAVGDARVAAADGAFPQCTPSWARTAALQREVLDTERAASPKPPRPAPAKGKFRRRSSLSMRMRPAPGPSRCIEDVRDAAVLAAPITDIIVRAKGMDPPDLNYYQIKVTVGGRRALVNAGSWGKDTFFWIRKDPTWTHPAITGLTVILPDRGEFIPPGFSMTREQGAPLDLNESTSGERIYLCRKVGTGNPIVDLQVVLLRREELPPPSYSLVSHTPLGYLADVNTGSAGTAVHLAYRQALFNLEVLKHEELLPLAAPAHLLASPGVADASLLPPGPAQLPPHPPLPSPRDGHVDSGPFATQAVADALQRISEEHDRPQPPVTAAASATDLQLPYDDNGDAAVFTAHPFVGLQPGEELFTGVVDVAGNVEHPGKRQALRALLAGLYLRQGAAPARALEGLQELLATSDFFQSGLGELPPAGWTLLDVAIDATCDHLELFLETSLEACVSFLVGALDKSGGVLHAWVGQRVIKALYGAAIFHASRVHGWVQRNASRPYREAAGTPHRYPKLAFDGLRQLGRSLMRWVEAGGAVNGLEAAAASPLRTGSSVSQAVATGWPLNTSELIVRDVLTDFLDTILDHVELARVIHAILNVVLRSVHGGNGGENAPWAELHGIASRVFSNQHHANLLVLFCLHCKAAVKPLRRLPSGELVARDLASKLVGLELLAALLRDAGEHFTSSNVFGYLVRRLASTVILQNAVYCLWDSRVLQAILAMTSALWDKFRRHMRLEMAVIADSLLLPILRCQPSTFVVRTEYQLGVLREMLSWFENTPQHLVELFLNFDMDASARNWNVFEGLCAALCALSEVNVPVPSPADAADEDRERRLRGLQRAALRAVTQIARSMMDASGHAHLLKRDTRTRKLSMKEQSGGWVLEDTLVNEGDANAIRNAREAEPPQLAKAWSESGARRGKRTPHGRITRSASNLMSAVAQMVNRNPEIAAPEGLGDLDSNGLDLEKLSQDAKDAEESKTLPSPATAGETDEEDAGEAAAAAAAILENLQLLPAGMVLKRPSHNRASSIVMRQNEQQRNREQLRQALEIYRQKSLKKAIKYLIAVNFISDTPRDIASFLRLYAHELSEEDIGDYLGEGGVTESDEKYYNLIRLSFVRAISFVNMRFEPALRRFLTRCGFKLPGEAQKVDRILSTFCLRYWEDNRGTVVCPFSNSDTMFVVAFAVIMLNTDLHRAYTDAKSRKRRMTKQEFARNLRGVDESPDLNTDFLSAIYDSIAAYPIAIGVDLGADGSRAAPEREADAGRAQQRFMYSLTQRLRRDEEMLAGLELNGTQNRFLRVGVDTSLSLDLLRLTFEAVWFHFHGVVNYILEGEGRQDTEAVNDGLDILNFALSAAIFLNMETVRAAFATQLAKFRYRFGPRAMPATPSGDLGTYFIQGDHLQEPWFQNIVRAAQEDAWEAIASVHQLFQELKTQVQENDQRRELEALARRIDPRADLLNGPRTFIKEGNLVKVCRSGKKVTYRFFLFSDRLLYTHQALVGGVYRLHEALPVGVMRVEDVPNSAHAAFHIHHPRKAFIVHAPSEEEKRIWMRVLADAIETVLQKRDMEKQLSLVPALVQRATDGRRSLSTIESSELSTAGELRFSDASLAGLAIELPASTPELKRLYRKGVLASAQLLQADGESSLTEAEKLDLHGLFRQAQHGDCPETSGSSSAGGSHKDEAWRRCRGLGRAAAKAAFVRRLDELVPDWQESPAVAKTPKITPRGASETPFFAS